MTDSSTLPALCVIDRDPRSLAATVSALVRRFGNDYTVLGLAPEEALEALQHKVSANEPVALLLFGDADPDLLTRAHELHPHAKRVLLVDRDYTTHSPAVQAIALGRVDYHIVRPWSDMELLYGPMSEYLSSWTRTREP